MGTYTMSDKQLQELFCLAQHGRAKHKKYLNNLRVILESQSLEEFFSEFMRLLLHVFYADISNGQAISILEFASSFCVEIVTEHEKRISESDEPVLEHPFFVCLVERVLEYVDLSNFNIRFHSCQFLALLFGKFGADIFISDGICDSIQKVLLERMWDPKPQVRCQAIKVLLRLQNIQDVNCPVMEAFTDSLTDPAPSVRKLIIESIAPCPATLGPIIARLRDVDGGVRVATFTKLSRITPKIFTIVYRQSIVMSGITESNAASKRTFENKLLPKWLEAYDSNVIEFMDALKLDAHEEDIAQTETIYKYILPIIFKTLPLNDLLKLLNLDEAKLVPINDLSIEKVNYWSFFINYLKEVGDVEFDDIAPVLTNFASYIDRFIKLKSQKSLEYWEELEYAQILRKLFEMLPDMDVSDEFGRQSMQKLIVSVLMNVKLKRDVIGSIIKAFHTIITDVDELTFELCSIITNIKDPEEEIQIPFEMRRDQEIQIAQRKVKLYLIEDEMKIAVKERQYNLIDKLNKDAAEIEKEVKDLENKYKQSQTHVVRKPDNSMETLCRCMDIVLALMENIRIEKLPVPLMTFKQEFLANEQIDGRYPGVYHKMFKMTCLYAILDKQLALDSIQIICTPVISYKVSNNYDKTMLKDAVGAISDLIRVHGPDIFNKFATEEEAREVQNVRPKKKRGNDRTLYSETDTEMEATPVVNVESITLGVLLDIILDMLDDTSADIREYATVALTKMVVKGLCVNSSLLTRLLLKWFNPSLNTEDKHDHKMQQYIGTAISRYISNIESAPTVFEQAILPTLCSIGNAPKTSPLSEVDYDDVLQCLIQFTRIRKNSTSSIHKHIAYSILAKLNHSNEQCVRILSKMLLSLDIPGDDPTVIRELSQEVNVALDNVTDKISIKYLGKYFSKLNGLVAEVDETGNNLDSTEGTKRSSTTSTAKQKRKENSNTSENVDSLPSANRIEGTKRSSTTSTANQKRNENCEGSDTENVEPLPSASEEVEQTPAKRSSRIAAKKPFTTPGNRRTRKQSGGWIPGTAPKTRTRNKTGETVFATPARETRQSKHTNPDTIQKELDGTETNDASSRNLVSNENNSTSSNDSVFTKEDQEQIKGNKRIASVKRRKVRGRNSNPPADDDDVSASNVNENNGSDTKTTASDTSHSTDTDARYSESSSDSEDVPEAPPRRKSQRKL